MERRVACYTLPHKVVQRAKIGRRSPRIVAGARVLRVAGATLDSELVEHRFGEMTADLDRKIVDFAERVDESAESLLDEEEGKLALALRTWLDEVGTLLGETFDETSKKSAIAKLEKMLEQARKEQVRAVRQLLDPHDDESPLGHWRSEIVKTVKERSDKIEEAIDDLTAQLGIKSAVARHASRPRSRASTSRMSCSRS